MKKVTVRLLISCLILCLLSGCSSSKSTSADTLHNGRLGINVSLGMTKEKIDKMLGEPTQESAFYSYDNGDLTVTYSEGKATMLVSDNDGMWKSIGDIGTDTTEEQVSALYGAPTGNNSVYFFDGKKQVQTKEDAKTYLMISFDNGTVDSIAVVAVP